MAIRQNWEKMRKTDKKVAFYIIAFLTVLDIVAFYIFLDFEERKFLEVNFFDVGQGDAIFIETPRGYQILIDGGPNSTIIKKLAGEMLFWDRTIDLVVLTHPEKDHLTGLIEVLKRYRVKNVLWTGVIRDNQEFKEWQSAARKEGAKTIIAVSGEKIKGSDFLMKVLLPQENLKGREVDKTSNDTSVVSRLVFGKTTFLFTGDISKKAETLILEAEEDIGSNVLKIAHHGSKYSSGENFIKAVSPEIAVISAGKNRYGHPHPEVLSILKKYDIKVLKTLTNGDIKIISDGRELRITTNCKVSPNY